jgi:hypothetical protein
MGTASVATQMLCGHLTPSLLVIVSQWFLISHLAVTSPRKDHRQIFYAAKNMDLA